jgi:hypothetical protein
MIHVVEFMIDIEYENIDKHEVMILVFYKCLYLIETKCNLPVSCMYRNIYTRCITHNTSQNKAQL